MQRIVVRLTLLTILMTGWVAGLSAEGEKRMKHELDIPYERFVLDNGLTVIINEDHKAPIVAVNVWYHVGSKNEKPGKTGFAHLFEHLMFNGSEHFNDDYFKALETVGATDLNGTTNEDRTNYFQNVPTSALDLALWMESDRMGHLLGAVDQEKLNEQRGVVQNEKRQYENYPYSIADELISKNTYPAGHPYSWTVIGSMADLEAASLEDVRDWFKSYYGAANAVLVISGDVDTAEAKQKVERFFGDIPSGPPVARQNAWVARRTGTHRQTVQDRVPLDRIYMVWNVPEWKAEETTFLELAGDVLSSGKTSRFYKRLVYDDQIAASVHAYVDDREIGSHFVIRADAKPGVPLQKVETALTEELERFFREGPGDDELARVKTDYRARFIRGVERIGGFGGKSDILATNQVFAGSPDFYKTILSRVENAGARHLKEAAETWLSDGVYILEVHSFPEYSVAAADVDRSRLPETATPPKATFPSVQRTTLKNGLDLLVAERHSVPVVHAYMLIDAGSAVDLNVPGLAKLTMEMIDEGTPKRDSLEIDDALRSLGARLNTGTGLDACWIYLNALKENLPEALDLFSDVVLNPVFPEKDFQRLQKRQIDAIKQEKSRPTQMALRVFPVYLFGTDHPYGTPLTGSGTEESVSGITRDDLVRFHRTWVKPNNATLIVVGDITLKEMAARCEALFSHWERGEVPAKEITEVAPPSEPVVYVMDKPGAPQSLIIAGHIAPPTRNPREPAIETMNQILGGTFTSRINMNLREDKHWTYGASSFFFDARGQRPFIVYTSVQTDKTDDAMMEIRKELKTISTDQPPNEKEFETAKINKILKLPGQWETAYSIVSSIADQVQYDLPADYYRTYGDKIRSLSLDEVIEVARDIVLPDRLIWVIVGDKEKILSPIKKLGVSALHLIDSNGRIIE